VGYVPLPESRTAAWACGLALLAFLSALASPVSSIAVAQWKVLALGLFIFPAITVVSKDQRARIDDALRACAWVLVILAFYQHYREHISRPFSAFLNTNVFAGTVLMFLPVAWQKDDWFLAAGLFVCLAWSHSVGAWLGLAGALMLTRRHVGAVGYWCGAAIAFLCLVAIYAKLQSPEVFHRWEWWVAAARMAAKRPWFGFGPGSFAYVMPSFQPAVADLSSMYAHQHFLETAAECGWLYLLLWVAGLLHFLRRGGSHKRFAALAVLIQSLWDYPLSIPANYWLFCYFVASAAPQTARGLNVRSRGKAAAVLAVLAVTLIVSRWDWKAWEADKLRAQATERFTAGAPDGEVQALLARSARLADDYETERMEAEVNLKTLRATGDASLAQEAARHLESSVRLNPYRPSTWAALERLYVQLGETGQAQAVRASAAAYAPQAALRPEPR
jgi:hypothetical protein